MQGNNIASMSADECADLHAKNKILPNNIGPKPRLILDKCFVMAEIN
jgi:hypothetical protein